MLHMCIIFVSKGRARWPPECAGPAAVHAECTGSQRFLGPYQTPRGSGDNAAIGIM